MLILFQKYYSVINPRFLALGFFILGVAHAGTPQGDCFKSGTVFSGMNSEEAAALCNSAPSAAPVDCFKMATTFHSLTTLQAQKLCAQASSVAPAQCYQEVFLTTPLLDPEHGVELCRTRAELIPHPAGVRPQLSNAPTP
jgi:hypothetical protein